MNTTLAPRHHHLCSEKCLRLPARCFSPPCLLSCCQKDPSADNRVRPFHVPVFVLAGCPPQKSVPSLPPWPVGPVLSGPGLPLRPPPIPLFAHWGALPCQCLPPSPVLPSAGYWYAGSSSGLSDHAGPAHVAPLGKTFPSNLVQSTHPGRVPTPAPALSPPLISSQLMPS